MAHKAGFTAVMSHRSGETEDSTIADLAVAVQNSRNLTYGAARLKDQGKPFKQEAAMAKLHASEVAERVAADINIEWVYGSDSLAQHWTQLLNNQIAPSRGLMVAL